jgi:hypothetical protein
MNRNLNIMGVTPGETTGWAIITIPRGSIFGNYAPEIIEWDYGLFNGPAAEQAMSIARLMREVQGLEFGTGPALIIETAAFSSEDKDAMIAVYIGAMLQLLQHQKMIGDGTLNYQHMDLAFSDLTTDVRMKKLGLLVRDCDEVNDAARHAITALHYARADLEFAKKLWPYKFGWDMNNLDPKPNYEYARPR